MPYGGVMMMRSVGQKNGEAGSALVEFAVASVIILTVLFGIIDMGRALFAYDWVSNAARIGTRYAMVRGTSCSTLVGGCESGPGSCGYSHNPPLNGACQSDVVAFLNSQAIGIDTSELTVTANCDVGASAFGPLPCAPGQGVIVKVDYHFSFITPLVPHTANWHMKSASARVVSQ
jgi:TadE-like protein